VVSPGHSFRPTARLRSQPLGAANAVVSKADDGRAMTVKRRELTLRVAHPDGGCRLRRCFRPPGDEGWSGGQTRRACLVFSCGLSAGPAGTRPGLQRGRHEFVSARPARSERGDEPQAADLSPQQTELLLRERPAMGRDGNRPSGTFRVADVQLVATALPGNPTNVPKAAHQFAKVQALCGPRGSLCSGHRRLCGWRQAATEPGTTGPDRPVRVGSSDSG
jgi:hypothetical protein